MTGSTPAASTIHQFIGIKLIPQAMPPRMQRFQPPANIRGLGLLTAPQAARMNVHPAVLLPAFK